MAARHALAKCGAAWPPGVVAVDAWTRGERSVREICVVMQWLGPFRLALALIFFGLARAQAGSYTNIQTVIIR